MEKRVTQDCNKQRHKHINRLYVHITGYNNTTELEEQHPKVNQ